MRIGSAILASGASPRTAVTRQRCGRKNAQTASCGFMVSRKKRSRGGAYGRRRGASQHPGGWCQRSVSSGVQNEHTADGRYELHLRREATSPGFDDVQVIADRLLARTPVLMDVEHLDVATARRLLDFLGGTTYAVRGHIQPAGENAFLLTPGGVEVDPNSLPPELSQEFTFRRRL